MDNPVPVPNGSAAQQPSDPSARANNSRPRHTFSIPRCSASPASRLKTVLTFRGCVRTPWHFWSSSVAKNGQANPARAGSPAGLQKRAIFPPELQLVGGPTRDQVVPVDRAADQALSEATRAELAKMRPTIVRVISCYPQGANGLGRSADKPGATASWQERIVWPLAGLVSTLCRQKSQPT